MSKVLNVRGKVLPAANASVVLHAEMEDGRVVSGESTIPEYGQRIKRVFLTPEQIDPLPETIDVIREADLIIIGWEASIQAFFPICSSQKSGKK